MIRNLQSNFKGRDAGETPFKPTKKGEPKSVELFFNSQNRIQGTNTDAVFNVNLAQDFNSDRLNVRLKNFIPTYPTGTYEGIVNVELIGVENPYSYSSSNQNTHRILGTFPLNDGLNKMYPPANMTANTTTFSNLPYGNGTYTATVPNRDPPFKMFDGNSNTTANYWGGGYGVHANASNNTNTGAYNQSVSTTMSGSNYFGATWNIQLPQRVVPTSYTLQHSSIDIWR